jgi:hypothetical protein
MVIKIYPFAEIGSYAVKVILIVTPEAVTELLDSCAYIDEELIEFARRVTPPELLTPTLALVSFE